jgi:hypothetical protein
MPRSIAPATRPPMRTSARVTRWIKAIMGRSIPAHTRTYLGVRGGVREDAVGQHALEQTVRRLRCVAPLHTDEREDAALDGPDGVSADADTGFSHSLDQRDHLYQR